MRRLKADLHTHSGDDPRDVVAYSSETLIDCVAARGVEVLSITCHEANIYTDRLSAYAARRGVLLIPGIELLIEGSHVLAINPDREQERATTFAELRRLGRRDAAFIAPHPFYPIKSALRNALIANIDLFDLIEYCTLYYPGLNFNRRACLVAKRYDLPMVGTSDTHELPYVDSTFTWVEAEPTVSGVIEGLRSGRVEVLTGPRPAVQVAQMAYYTAKGAVHDMLSSRK